MSDVVSIAGLVTAVASVVITYLLSKPYVRVVKMFRAGKTDSTSYKLKNAGSATALNIVLQDRLGQAADIDLRLGHRVKYVDASTPAQRSPSPSRMRLNLCVSTTKTCSVCCSTRDWSAPAIGSA